MSRIDDLIAKYCPDGIKFKTLDENVDILNHLRISILKQKRIPGSYPYYGANGIYDWVNEYVFDGTYLLIGSGGTVINENKAPILNWVSGKFCVNNHAHVLGQKPNGTLLRFIYYYLQTYDISNIVYGTIQMLNQKNLKSIPVPILPLKVQQEIVSILDKFDTLINNISEGLPAELEARKQQYEYYRKKLMTF